MQTNKSIQPHKKHKFRSNSGMHPKHILIQHPKQLPENNVIKDWRKELLYLSALSKPNLAPK